MRVNVESPSSTEKKIEVFIPAETVTEKFNTVFKDFQQNAKVKGFRPGKVPNTLIQSMFKNDIVSEVSTRLVSESIEGAIKQSSLAPVSKPNVTPDKAARDSEFHYSATFEIVPEFTLGEYLGIPLKKQTRSVTEEDVERAVQGLRARASEARPLEQEREARAGDYVIVDFEGTLDGKAVRDLKKADTQFIVGEGKLIPEFDTNILGMKPGEEKGFQVPYPDDFQISEAAGRVVDYKLKLKEVRQRYIPEVNDDFAKDLGQESLEELKKKIREEMERRTEEHSQTKLRADIIKTLLHRTPFDVPASIVITEASRIRQDFLSSLQQRGVQQLPPLTEEMERTFAERALVNVKASLVVEAIAEREGIQVEQSELDDKIRDIATSYGLPFDKAKEVYGNNDKLLASLEVNIIEDKVLRFLIERASVEAAAEELNQIDNEG
ncbi:MAG: trigger factor [Deltaproteobacteria bacterium]